MKVEEVRSGQASLLGWVKVKEKRQAKKVYIFLVDINRVIDENLREYGPFKKGDMVSENLLSESILKVLLRRGAIMEFNMKGV